MQFLSFHFSKIDRKVIFFFKRPSKLFNYRKTNICTPQEIFLFSTFDYSNLSFHFSNNQDKKKKGKTLFMINKKKRKKRKKKDHFESIQEANFFEWIFSNIYNYRYSSSRFVSMHPSTIDSCHSPSPLPTLAAIYRRTINFRQGETFLNAHCGVLLLAVI